MKTVTIYEAKTNLSKLIQEVLDGEEVIIAKGKKPLVKLVVLDDPTVQRRIGGLQGSVTMSDDFDDEVDDFEEYMGK